MEYVNLVLILIPILIVLILIRYLYRTYNWFIKLRMDVDRQASHVQVHLKKKFDLKVITPGIRAAKSSDDQKRVATAKTAIKAGSDYLVVGRPIIKGKNFLKAAEEVLSS